MNPLSTCSADGGAPLADLASVPASKRPWREFVLSPAGAVLLLALLGMLMVMPTVSVGLIGDDFLFKALLAGQAHHAHPGAFFGLFTFADGDLAHVQHLKDLGQVPWWTADQARMSFWRPISELSHWLDYRLWPDSPTLMHVHSMLWYGLLIGLLGRLYFTLDSDRLRSAVALFIFATSAMHLMTVIWLAARNQLIAGCLVVLTLQFYHQWRQGQGLRNGLLALAALTLGLLSAEAAIAAMAYLVAYAVVYEHGRPLVRRLAALLPFVLVVLCWRVIYSHLGYGSAETGGYIDPVVAPVQFGLAMLMRLPSLLLAFLFGVPSSTLGSLTDAGRPTYAMVAAVAVGVSVLVGQYFKVWAQPLARFYGLAAVLSLVPVCAAEPNDRLLLNAEFGLSALLALLFTQAFRHRHQYAGPVAWAAKGIVAVLMLVHLLCYPLATLAVGAITPTMVRGLAHEEPLSMPEVAANSHIHVILVNPPNALFVGYYPWVRSDHGLRNAESTQALASGDQTLTLTVLSTQSLRMTALQGFGESVTRDFSKHPFKRGDHVRTRQFVATVREVTPYGKPKVVDFEFSQPLASPSWQILQWSGSGYVRLKLPPVGDTITMPAINVGKLAVKRVKALF